jgi:hypothetical protein
MLRGIILWGGNFIKQQICNHRYRLSSISNNAGKEIFHLQCWKCQKKKHIVTFKKK